MTDIITITGNIATAPEHRVLPSGIPVTRFRVASGTRRFDRESNAWVDGPTNWYSVSAYRTLADNARDSLQKGERVVVTGRLRLRAWESDGRKGLEAEIDADGLGHDLLFGVSTFRRTAARSAAAPDEAAPADGQDAWTTLESPEAAPTDWGSAVTATSGGASAREPVLEGASGDTKPF
ncbi:single-stranded DNA-binding protein [Microbacterium sp. JZ31]|uniref:single-stranded DNA-binding protein n=1 Tax=Microbacterium sp. JZ31 TaxID=1906274 RepID=UPI00193251F5|nr:single-stranded DNA-binding protein [Microbacterium sp. JZ31]